MALNSYPERSRTFETVSSFVLDAFMAYAGVKLALYMRFGPQVPDIDVREMTSLMPLLFLARLGSYYAAGIYRRSFIYPRSFDAADLVQAWATGTVILSASVFFGRILEASRLVLVYEAAINLGGIFIWRSLLRLLLRPKGRELPAAVYKDPALMPRLNHFLEQEGWEFRIGKSVSDLADLAPDEVLFVSSDNFTPELFASLKNRRFFVITNTTTLLMASGRPSDLGGFVVIDGSTTARSGHYMASKRAMDFSVALTGLFLIWPIFLAVAALIRMTSTGPAIFRQDRIGRDGRLFSIYKFRTMVHGIEGPVLTEKEDSRITALGKFLREWSIDELPQLINVLFGTLSLVGPRPEIPDVVDGYPSWRRTVLDVPPGITGLVQVSGRDELADEEKGRLDLFYATNCSFEMDVSILLKTFRAVIKHRGRT